MFSFHMFLSMLAVTLLTVTAESSSDGIPLSGSELRRLLSSPVFEAELMIRPLQSENPFLRALGHSGVRVTLADGSQWLIHKGRDFGVTSQTVVTDTRYMSSKWRKYVGKNFYGSKTVSDFVRTGGETYNLLFNCHVASAHMMLQ